MASPHVVGLAGLLLSQDQSRTPSQLISLLTSGSNDLGAGGWDPYFGNGRIDAFMSLGQDAAPTGQLSGMVWLDSNGDGVKNPYETKGLDQASIKVTDSASGQSFTVNSNANGEWTVGQLPAGSYTIQMTAPTGYFFTTDSSQSVTLVYGQQVAGLNFGLTDRLPADSISNFQVSRRDNQVTVEWVITRSEVQSITIERSTQSGSQYASIGEMQAQVVGTNTVIRITDQLPPELANATLYYRLRIQPTNLVVGPMVSLSDTGAYRIFLPISVRN